MRADLTAIWQKEKKTILFVTYGIEEPGQLDGRVIVMTSRPARMKAEAPVSLPRPQDLDASEYLQLRDGIFERLGMSLKVGASV